MSKYTLFFMLASIWSTTYYNYEIVGRNEIPRTTIIAPDFVVLDFSIEPTQHGRVFKEPYTMRLSIMDYENNYRLLHINSIAFTLNNTQRDLLKNITEIYVPAEGRAYKRFSASDIIEFSRNKNISLSKDKAYKIRDVILLFDDLNINHKYDKTFEIEIDMSLEDFENNVLHVIKKFVFEQTITKKDYFPS